MLNKIKHKISFTVALLVMIVLSTVILTTNGLLTTLFNNHIQKEAEQSVKNNAKLLAAILESEKVKVMTYASTDMVQTMEWKVMKGFLEREQKQYKNLYDVLFISDLNGNFITTGDITGNISSRSYFPRVLKGETVISEPVISISTGNLISVIATPVINETGEIIGIMGASMSLEGLSSIISDLKVEHPSSYSYVVSEDGTAILHPDADYILKENISIESSNNPKSIVETSSKILSQRSGYARYTYQGIDSFVYFSQIEGTDGWRLITRIPKEYLTAPVKNVTTTLMLVAIIGIILSLCVGLIVGKRISTPIIYLDRVFQKAIDGDLRVRANIGGKDELGKASQSFNKMMDQLIEKTYYDSLTNLPNSTYFREQFSLVLRDISPTGETFTIALLSIREFKRINESYGFRMGDTLLRQMALRLQTFSDKVYPISLMCRFTGDEMMVLIRGTTDMKKSQEVLTNLYQAMVRPYQMEEPIQLNLFVSGIFYRVDGTINFDETVYYLSLLRQQAKRIHRTLWIVTQDDELFSQARKNTLLGKDCIYAMERRELEVWYQPICDLQTGKKVSIEALLRWRHPIYGMVPPSLFIPMAEEQGFIDQIGLYVIREVCRQQREWNEQGKEKIRVSVNISPQHFGQDDFVEQVLSILDEEGIEGNQLTIEITEDVAMLNLKSQEGKFMKLHSANIHCSVDDFGTGYSSLRYLAQLPIDQVKIDRAFVGDMLSNEKDRAVIKTIISMAEALNLDCVAEGVETEDQHRTLVDLGCFKGQGYLFAKPTPPSALEA